MLLGDGVFAYGAFVDAAAGELSAYLFRNPCFSFDDGDCSDLERTRGLA